MKPAPFQYHRATTLNEATEMASTLDNARLLSGGQSLMPMMNLRYATPDHLIDLNPIEELAGIDIDESQATLGAMTRQRDVLESNLLARKCPIFSEALSHVGHIQTRNRGTIGGSLVHMDPSAELMGLAALMDARITLSSTTGTRDVSIDDYPLGYMTPAIESDEILSSVSFDLWPDGHGWDFREFAQRHGDFAIVGVGSLLVLAESGVIDRAAIVLIGVADAPMRLSDAEDLIIEEKPCDSLFKAAADLTGKRDMMGDALVTSSYRSHLTSVLVRRSLHSAVVRARLSS